MQIKTENFENKAAPAPDGHSRNFTLSMAPLRGFTSAPYRNVFSQHFDGFDDAVAPFISTVSSHRIKDKYMKDVLPENNQSMPVIPQLIGKSPEDFILMARRLSELGHEEINWNLGCPYPMVAKKGRGSGMLPHPEKVDAFLDKVIPAVPCRLSVKTRIGRFSADEIHALMPVFNRYPLAELIVHPRIGVQLYDGVPNLDIFEFCLEQSTNPVTYNGDINSYEDYTRLSRRLPAVHRWMIGRGAIADPFLPSVIKSGGKQGIENKAARFREFHDALYEAFMEVFSGPSHLMHRMKGFWHYFEKSFVDCRKTAKKIYKAQRPEAYLDIVHRFFDEKARWKE